MTATDPLDALEAVVRSRRGGDPAASYVASLFAKGRPKIAQKLGEEAVEAAIAAVQGDREALKGEAADLLFHLIVLLVDSGLRLDDVRAELVRREGLSGLIEKAQRAHPAPPPAPPPPPRPAPPVPPVSPASPSTRPEASLAPRPLSAGPAYDDAPRPLPIAKEDR
ncbi:phosphoribosyl-ATP diphosphatase [Sphingomonas baiyangensis]|uniref:Phosphoribosyl-ATP pyrophosphatase n=1 Tax=Sphingomonas baiyangensis TaxID=2572576 RepID=A0A4U1L013_9SPHN|nr:phosphoribosyl-ATP diphosphatase [Sphingomonas baiyangensis]